ncbi:alpha/beta hydrolase [Nocardioides sp. LMS-CY]|uniref:alpha/beta hydrolase family protein n=1 Tax=Nocardioides sp. (strain LMS-CY) TaxID=2840457 RepID=UPI001C000156|nr:alpha/beta hydrolase family protein [Nocardioides sp. LMS-CY]QWF20853.1 alpha/beta hydrolase [Nocardioides sp. LMS-CY]
MSTFVLVHGAFRGGWAWDRVAPLLRAAGHEVHAPTLSETASGLETWVDEVAALVTGDDVVLAGHSQGGVVVREVALRVPVRAIVYVDAAVPEPGERAVDLGASPLQLPPRETVIPPRPIESAGDLDADTAAWMNERLAPVPFAPSLDPASVGEPVAATTYVFCTGTPAAYPCGTTRSRLDERGIPYAWVEAGHDAPLTRPDAVAELLLAAAREEEIA